MRIYEATVKRINNLMTEQGLTQNGLAYKSGIPQATIKSILNGESKNPGIVTLKKICDGLEISINTFFDSDDFKTLEQELL
ncbi:helix-turn-helix domain-containing protein [Aminipila sp.]|uniref:helix-turn-helix domain-containing protein n=1 Tax=Aminipila sp. TaxID=2060095 RepID=UPI00289E0246|nr:helix-turn-helix transcriptional regulator [Aminipila sp.]